MREIEFTSSERGGSIGRRGHYLTQCIVKYGFLQFLVKHKRFSKRFLQFLVKRKRFSKRKTKWVLNIFYSKLLYIYNAIFLDQDYGAFF